MFTWLPFKYHVLITERPGDRTCRTQHQPFWVNFKGNCCQKTTRISIRSISAQHNVDIVSDTQKSPQEEVAGKGSRSTSSEAAEGRQRTETKVRNSGRKKESFEQQGQQVDSAPGQDDRQKPQRAAEAQERAQPGVASKKGPHSAAGTSPRDPQKPQQKRRRRARKRSAGSKQQHTADSSQQLTGSEGAGPSLQHDGLQGGTSNAQTLHAESIGPSTAPPNHVEQKRQGQVLPIEQQASLQPEVAEPILAGQTVQLGSQDSLVFLMGLCLSAEAASHVLSTALSVASDGSAGHTMYASALPAWQMEAVCRTLVDLGVKVRDLGQLFVRCPALLSCPADELRQRAGYTIAILGDPTNKITKDACLANLLTSEPCIMVDQDAMERLQLLASQVHRIGKGLPEECSNALCAIAYHCPEVFGMESVELLQSIRFLTLQLQVDGKGVLKLYANHPNVLIRGTAFLFEALLAVLPMEKAQLKAVVREHPLILGVELEQAALVVKVLRAAGLNDDDLRQLVEAFPGVLSKRPKDVKLKMAFLTKLLGQPAESMLGAPRVFFNKSVVSNIGPRFSFIKDCLPECTTQWAPTTILRSSDEDFCMLTGAPVEQYAIYKKQWQEANGRRFRLLK